MAQNIEPLIFYNAIEKTPWIFQTSLLTTEMSHDRSKDTKRQNKEFEKACFGMPPKIGSCQTKIGTHRHKEKKFQNMAVGSSRCCRGVVTACGQMSNKMAKNNDTTLKKGRRGLWTALPVAKEQLHHYATTRQVGQHGWLHISRHVQLHESASFIQVALFNATTAPHTRPTSHIHPTCSIDNFASRQGAPTPYLQQHRQEHSMRQWHACIFRLISPKVSRASFHRLLSFYPVQT